MREYVYPRLPLSVAMNLLSAIRARAVEGGRAAVIELASPSHPKAHPVPTGGRVATSDRIDTVRRSVLEQISPWIPPLSQPLRNTVVFDLELGRALHRELRIVPADAGHDETWHFLSLLVFPDLAVLRFPALHQDRLLGGRRNALRRVWQREEVLGDLLLRADEPLGEDEAVGLFERTALVRNRRLARVLASEVMARSDTGNRSQWAREVYKRVTYVTGPIMMDVLSDNEMLAVVRAAMAAVDDEIT